MIEPEARHGSELTIRPEGAEARRASAWLESVALAQAVPLDQLVRLDHCLDEALANVITHGGPAALASSVRLQLAVRRCAGVCTAELLVVDAGVAFDPSASPAAPASRPASLAEVDLGGLGLTMMRRLSDELSYQRRDGCNHLTIRVTWAEAG